MEIIFSLILLFFSAFWMGYLWGRYHGYLEHLKSIDFIFFHLEQPNDKDEL